MKILKIAFTAAFLSVCVCLGVVDASGQQIQVCTADVVDTRNTNVRRAEASLYDLVSNHPDQEVRDELLDWKKSNKISFVADYKEVGQDPIHVSLNEGGREIPYIPSLRVTPAFVNCSDGSADYQLKAFLYISAAHKLLKAHFSQDLPIRELSTKGFVVDGMIRPYYEGSHSNYVFRRQKIALKEQWRQAKVLNVTRLMPEMVEAVNKYSEDHALDSVVCNSLLNLDYKGTVDEWEIEMMLPAWHKRCASSAGENP